MEFPKPKAELGLSGGVHLHLILGWPRLDCRRLREPGLGCAAGASVSWPARPVWGGWAANRLHGQERPKIHGSDFKRWRKSLNLSQKEAAEALGLKRRVVQYYEKGERDGKSIDIPKTVRLACFALAEGAIDYSGPQEKSAGRKAKRKGKDRAAEQPKHQKAKDKKHAKEQVPGEVLHKDPKFPSAILERGAEIRVPGAGKSETKKRPKRA